jgi:hypothetical protein
MKSGHDFHETCNKVYVTAYRHEMASVKKKGVPRCTKQEVSQMLPPPNWEYSKDPWYFGLVVKIFRRDPQLAFDVADVMADLSNIPLLRAELNRCKQQDAVLRCGKKAVGINSLTDSSSLSCDAGGDSTADCWNPNPYPSVVSSSNVNNRIAAGSVMIMAAENQERFASAKKLLSKAQAGTYNIVVCVAVMEELERRLNLLNKIRGCIGKDKYAKGVHDVYAALPKYGTFKNEVKVIDVDNNNDPPQVLLKRKLAKAAMSIATATIPIMQMEELIWKRCFQTFLVTM